MDEPNSQPTRCPCGFFGSPQTLGLCSKCFREREQNQNQAVADISRPHSSSSQTDQSRLSMTPSTDQSRVSASPSSDLSRSAGSNILRVEITNDDLLAAGTTPLPRSSADTAASQPASNSLLSEPRDSSTDHRGQKRKLDETESCESPASKRSTNRHCCQCKCRLELAVREIGKCKCGSVFCLLHRLPEQHGCTFDHKEEGRREARAKMVPARKHVGTALKRLDSDS